MKFHPLTEPIATRRHFREVWRLYNRLKAQVIHASTIPDELLPPKGTRLVGTKVQRIIIDEEGDDK